MTITIQLNEKCVELVRQAICKAGSIFELANALELNTTTIYRMLNKRSKNMRLTTLIKLEEYLKK